MLSTENDDIKRSDLPLNFGRYELTGILGKGGMAQVFEASLNGPAGFQKRVAVKVIKLDVLARGEKEHVDFFVREARLGGLLKHPNIVDVYELGEFDQQLYIAMEVVDGHTLREIIRGEYEPPGSVILEIAAGVAAGLESAHTLKSEGLPTGLVHRDLKPSNILISRNGAVKVADFGVAVTVRGELASDDHTWKEVYGTVSYMSPEQLLGQPLDGRSDLFSFGLVLLELASYSPLPRKFIYNRMKQGDRRDRCMIPHMFLKEAESNISGISEILQKLLQFRPERRFQSADELLDAIDTLREHHGVSPRLRNWLQFSALTETLTLPSNPRLDSTLKIPATPPPPTSDSEPTVTQILQAPQSPPVLTNINPAGDGFVGRTGELETLETLLEKNGQLVTLKGTGGAGKTRIALQYARSAVSRFPGGVWFVDLTEARNAEGITQAFAGVLHLPLQPQSIEDQTAHIGEFLASKGRTLIIFDNVEQVVDSVDGTLGVWRDHAPLVSFLLTTREPTRLPGEKVITIQPMSVNEGVDLFRTRATAAGADLSESTDDTLQRLVSSLDGIPLSIELAAARASLLSPTQLVERLSERFKLLRSDLDSKSPKQNTLQDLIGWSWGLLKPWEQSAVAQLSVFRGGFSMEAAEAVIDLSQWKDAPWPLEVVSALYDKSMIHRWEVNNQARFGMYTSIQEYAEHKLGDQSINAQKRHAEYFSRLGRVDFSGPNSPKNPRAFKDQLDLELENLLAASERQGPELDEYAALCGYAAAHSYRYHGPYSEAATRLTAALTLRVPVRLRLRLENALGTTLVGLGRYKEAQELLKSILEEASQINDTQAELCALNSITGLLFATGNRDNRERLIKRGLSLANDLNDVEWEAAFTGKLGELHRKIGNTETALYLFEESLSMSKATGSVENQLVVMSAIGPLLQELGRIKEAMACFNEALALAREVGNLRSESTTLGNLGVLHHHLGNRREALEAYKLSLKQARILGHKVREALSLGNIGCLLNDYKSTEAESYLRAAIRLADTHYPVAAGAFRGTLGLVVSEQGRLEEALVLFEEGDALLREKHTRQHALLLCEKAKVLLLHDRRDEGEAIFQEANSLMASWVHNKDAEIQKLFQEVRDLLQKP